MRSYIFLLIFLASFLIPKIRDMIRDNAVGKQTRLGQNPKPQEASQYSLRNLSAQLNLLMSAAQDPNLTDQERASLEDKIDYLNQELDQALGAQEIEADNALQARGEAGQSMLDEAEFNQAQAQMEASLADQAPDNEEEWALTDTEADSIQLERLASNRQQSSRGSKVIKLNRKTLKDAVVYSEILKPKYQSK
ncbi:hypothetical protein [Abiotrophia defectiva]|jgi:hypothetical protein|uniref:Uncharacterized protein n=2 Tax=Abiotrophia defectiva TaxID=46125 RepID=A0A929QUE4_ABIDE|nr:hypothetical protein [Abiotrophia defectiva]MBF0935497.1 hypothetical protein [Abiotrophia defectiva]RKW14031.1 MAG: hypothetical protein D8B54_08815 [Catonella sp.]RKW15173.1 MAG: hypothetical protein D8B54_07565 [Catonella sp.]